MYGLVALNLPGLHSAFHLSTRDLDRGHLYVPLMQRKAKTRKEKSRKEKSRREQQKVCFYGRQWEPRNSAKLLTQDSLSGVPIALRQQLCIDTAGAVRGDARTARINSASAARTEAAEAGARRTASLQDTSQLCAKGGTSFSVVLFVRDSS